MVWAVGCDGDCGGGEVMFVAGQVGGKEQGQRSLTLHLY